METTTSTATPATKRKLSFHGSGGELFGIMILNWILTSITLGFYYPWARVKQLQYMYGNTELEGSRFAFTGTGKQVFIGFIKAIGVIILLILTLALCAFLAAMMKQNEMEHMDKGENVMQFSSLVSLAGFLIYGCGILILSGLAIHGGLRYRLAKTTWRNIHFGYRGEKWQLVGKYALGLILTVLTFGIYGSWFTTTLRTYLIGHIRFGSIHFDYTGDGESLFLLNLKGIFLTIITLGIYGFWYKKEWMNYWINNMEVVHGEQRSKLKGSFTGGGYFGLLVINQLLVIFTLGIAYPWTIVRTMRFVLENIEIPLEIDLNKLEQTEENYSDATGADLVEMMDLGII